MKKVIKWFGIVLGSLAVVLLLAYVVIYFMSESRLNTTHVLAVKPVKVPSGPEAVAAGERVVKMRDCTGCHNEHFEGKVFIEDPALGRVVAPNLTGGKGSPTATYTNLDWVRAIRHGLNKEGKPLKIMPSEVFYSISNQDLGNMIAYLKALPKVNSNLPESNLKPLARTLLTFNVIPLLPFERIDHQAPIQEVVLPSVSAEYGKYLTTTCSGCHGTNFKGGEPHGEGSPRIANITPGGNLGKWSEAQFKQVLRTGVTPEGKKLNPKFMPWTMTKDMTDDELKAIYLYLKSLPA
ncbi:c-type cytochrome [Adhaeribacter rhizoryzae]|uniref:Cytochrome c n=1 Tax=Adhaeribacter rhizoryzae TaxID=2607907 RepID=A0A5M6DL27_9BACT|nr:cytochrome c [Adhaeribacter rhizoryzae]KAA5548244.1 cytochrome c [Adhaeribacter rhizoryzae]